MQLGIHHTTLQRVSLKNSSYKTVQIKTQNNYCLEPNLMSFKTQGFESIATWACLDQSSNPGLWSFPFPHLLLSPTSLPIHPLTVHPKKHKGFPHLLLVRVVSCPLKQLVLLALFLFVCCIVKINGSIHLTNLPREHIS